MTEHGSHHHPESTPRTCACASCEGHGAAAVATGSVCPSCGGPVTTDTATVCPECRAPHHRACWDFHEGCAKFGCPGCAGALPADPDHPSRLPVDRAARLALESRCRDGVALARRLWATLMVAATAFLTSFFLLVLSIAATAAGKAWIARPFDVYVQPILVVTALLAVGAFAVQGIWALVVQSRLQGQLGSNLQAPVTMPAEICEHLELPAFERRLVEVGDRVAALTVLTAFLVLVFATDYLRSMKLPPAPTFVVVFFGLGLPWLALSLAREQAFFARTLEHRCSASFPPDEA